MKKLLEICLFISINSWCPGPLLFLDLVLSSNSLNCTLLITSIFSQDGREICRGRLDDFSSILSPAFRAATVFVGIAVIIILICILAMVLFLMCRYVFRNFSMGAAQQNFFLGGGAGHWGLKTPGNYRFHFIDFPYSSYP